MAGSATRKSRTEWACPHRRARDAFITSSRRGVIRERVVRLEPRSIGLDLTVLIHIRMDRHTPERFAQFESAVRGYPEVQECYLITGQEADYQLKISVPNMDEYQRFLLTKITRIDGVIGVHSSFVLRKAVDTTALPLGLRARARVINAASATPLSTAPSARGRASGCRSLR